MNEKILGILGGMGIDVTAEFLARIIDITGAKKEQDNIPIIINHNPKIADRTQAIVYGGEDPLPLLKSSLEVLVKAGVDFIAIPCNTAHYYYDKMQRDTPVPIIHMIKEVVAKCLTIRKDVKAVGLLATTGTVNTELYQNKFVERDIKVILPDDNDQAVVMNSIMRIKSRVDIEDVKKRLIGIAHELIACHARIIVIGCTDISLIIKEDDLEVPIVDSLSVLADRTVQMALGKGK